MKAHLILGLGCTIGAISLAAQSVPPMINYQGRVQVDGVPFSGTGHFRIAIVNPDGTVTRWSNDGTSVQGASPEKAVDIAVLDGGYSIRLGDVSLLNMQALAYDVFTGAGDPHLRVWFDDGTHGSKLLSPDQPIAAAAYSMVAEQANSLAPGAQIPATLLAAGPVAGQVLSYDGSTLVWNSPATGGGSTGGGFQLAGTSAYYNSGNVGIGTTSPSAPLEVVAKWLTPGTTGVPNIQLSGQNPTLAWARSNLPRTSWIAHLGASDGLEFWERYQSGNIPPSDSGWVLKTRFDVDGSFFAVGNVTYGGRLAKLDTAEQSAATVRAADFNLGHSTRRGAPGRALVDVGDALVVNYASDWGKTIIGGAITEVTTLQITGGADLAEPFALSHQGVPPGAVVVIDEKNPGKLRMSSRAYDKKVAGILSGANGIHPGISMIQAGSLEPGENVALSGRVHVRANLSAGAIEPGDFLTTSDVPGEAMKASDHERAQGAILGKAMTRLDETNGTVLVLVTLQ